MKVMLLNPPRTHEIVGNNPTIVEQERGFNPPLGLLSVAAYLLRHANHEVQVVDCQVEGLTQSDIRARLEGFMPDVVGLTAMTFTLIDVMQVVQLVKQVRPSTKVVLGGIHVHLFPEETVALKNVDYLVLGEGEIAFKELLDHIDSPDKLRSVPGLVFKHNGEVLNTGTRPFIEDLDALPFPARHLTPYMKYSSLLVKRDPVTTIFTSRGCPFRCAFCDRPNLGKRFRMRSPRNVVDELEECTKMGIHEFLFYDDTFTCDRERVIAICNESLRRKLDIGFDVRTRVDRVDEDLIRQLARAGCAGVHYGVEAGSERVLEVLQKGITIEQVKDAFRFTRKHGVPVLAYFMIGNPTETREEIEMTFRVLRKLNPDFVHMTILTPFPGTKVYNDGLDRGIFPRDHWREFAANPTSDFVPPHWPEHFTKQQLDELLVRGYREFYVRPGYIARRMLKLRSLSELKKTAKAGLKVFAMKARAT